RQRAVIGQDAGVAHFQVVGPAVDEDGAAALRAVDDAHAVDPRRVAVGVAGAVVGAVRLGRVGRAIGRIVAQVDAAVGERTGAAGGVLAPEVGVAVRGPDATAQNRDARAFIRAHQRRLLQNLRQVAVAGRIPADDRLERNAVHAQELRVRTAVLARRVVIRVVGARNALDRQAEQAVDLAAPGIQHAGRMRIRVDRDRRGADALQAYRLPHQHVLLVGARGDDDQIARAGGVDDRLDGLTGLQHGRGFAADRQ